MITDFIDDAWLGSIALGIMVSLAGKDYTGITWGGE